MPRQKTKAHWSATSKSWHLFDNNAYRKRFYRVHSKMSFGHCGATSIDFEGGVAEACLAGQAGNLIVHSEIALPLVPLSAQ